MVKAYQADHAGELQIKQIIQTNQVDQIIITVLNDKNNSNEINYMFK